MKANGSYTFISGALEPWRSPWLSRQQVMSRLMQKHRVVHMLPEETVDQALTNARRGGFLRRQQEVLEPNLVEFRPPAFFPRIYASAWLDRASARLRAWHLRRYLRRREWNNSILYLWHPRFHRWIGRAGERLSVFHCHDYYPAFYAENSAERRQTTADFEAIARRADVVFAVSDELAKEIKKYRTSNVFLLESGVDFDAIRREIESQRGGPPADLAEMKMPIVAHVGRVNQKVDFETLGLIADARPDWNVGVIGPKTGWADSHQERFDAFLSRPNAFYRPGAPHPQFARYLNALSVGLMAYRIEGTWMKYGSPLKAYEYLAAGKPVVSADVPAVRPLFPHVAIAHTVDEWTGAIERAMGDDTEAAKASRLNLARANSWEERSVRILDHIRKALREKESSHAA